MSRTPCHRQIPSNLSLSLSLSIFLCLCLCFLYFSLSLFHSLTHSLSLSHSIHLTAIGVAAERRLAHGIGPDAVGRVVVRIRQMQDLQHLLAVTDHPLGGRGGGGGGGRGGDRDLLLLLLLYLWWLLLWLLVVGWRLYARVVYTLDLREGFSYVFYC